MKRIKIVARSCTPCSFVRLLAERRKPSGSALPGGLRTVNSTSRLGVSPGLLVSEPGLTPKRLAFAQPMMIKSTGGLRRTAKLKIDVSSRLTVFLLLFFVVCARGNAVADALPTAVTEFFEMNCIGCHDESTSEGDLDLELLKLQLDDPENFHVWERIFDRIQAGEMPPDEELDPDEARPFLAGLYRVLHRSDAERIAKAGRVPARRLTRNQYERNLCKLLAIDVPLSDYLPAESFSYGFDTVSKSQQISDHLMAAYLQAADAALDAAFASARVQTERWKSKLDWKALLHSEKRSGRMPEPRPQNRDIVSWSTRQNFYGRMPGTSVPMSGYYRVRLRVQAVHPPQEGLVWCSVNSGVCSSKASTLYWVGSFEATKKTAEHEFVAWIREGHMLQVLPNDSRLKKVPVPVLDGPAGSVEPMGIPGVAIKWIELERIEANPQAVQFAMLGDTPVNEANLRPLITRFASRAFRRPVAEPELEPYFAFAQARLDETHSLAQALRAAYRALLCSPRLLYFEETPGRLDDYALANRLSHFLWGVGPDGELMRLAYQGRLGQPDVLRLQTNRLLDDPQSEIAINEFTDEWLQLYELESTTPDAKLYSEYDDVLHHSLTQETHTFVRELVASDLPVSNIVDSNFTFLNSRLARHYKVDWPGGQGFQRVKLQPGSHRGGIITQASVLKVTANGTTTSPIIRGVWMLERIMGQHVPPPPANIPAVEPDIRGAISIRDQIEKHKSLDSCAACHVNIDPPGFALESYDVIGGWRERYRATSNKKGKRVGLPVDPSHELASGEAFDDISGFKRVLVSQPEQLARNLASHLVTYATGATPTFADRSQIDAIVRATKPNDYGVRSIIHEIVQSPLFRNK